MGAMDRERCTPLHAAACGRKRNSADLLVQHGPNVVSTDKKGWLPFHFAAARGCFPALEFFFQNGSDITAVDRKGRSLLHLVAKSGFGCEESVEFLIHHGNDINARYFSGQTVFGASLQSNRPYFQKFYLENGGDTSAVDSLTGRTTLHVAAATDLIATVDFLLDQGLELEARRKNGDTPLHKAAAHGTPEMIQRLADRGTDSYCC